MSAEETSVCRPAIPSTIVGTEVGPDRVRIDARWLMAYAAAVAPHQPPCFDTTAADGPLAHPLFAVCYEWPLLLEIRARAIGEAAGPRGVHASHRLVIHRLARAGDELTSTARVVAVAPRRSGTLVIVRLRTADARGSLVSETDYGSLYRGVPLRGPAPDDGSPPSAVGSTPRGGHPALPSGQLRWKDRLEVPRQLAHVYTECARIWNPIHTDLAVARAAGLPGPILHGTATLALAVSRLVERDLEGRGEVVRGIEARFTGMVPLPSTLVIHAGGRDRHAMAFEVLDVNGAPVLRQGVLRL
jgi:acyl dehydratase